MAGKSYPITFVLGADDEATAEFKRATARMSAAAAGMSNVGRAMTVGLTAPIIGIGAAATGAAMQFQKEMGNVGTLIDETTEDLDKMGNEVLEIGSRTPVQIGELTSALYDVRSAGVGAGEAMGVLEKSAQLGVAGLGTTAEAADLVTSSINAFKLEGADAERVYDLIFKTVKTGKTTISGLAVGFGAAAGTIAASGTQLDEYLSSVAALTTTGQPAAQAHTQLKAVISGLTRETKDSSKMFATLGAKNLPDLIKQSGGLVPALKRIRAEQGHDNAAMLELVGSTEALNAVIGLTGNQADAQATALDSMRDGSDAVSEAFQKQSKKAAAEFQRTKNKIKASSIQIGNALLPLAADVMKKVARIADSFAGLDKENQKWILTIGATVAAIGPVLMIGGNVIALGVQIKGVFVAIGIAQTAMAAGSATAAQTMLVAFGAVIAPIAAIGAAIGAVIYMANELSKTLGEVGIGGTGSKMWDMGTLDVFAANDAALNEKASMRARQLKDVKDGAKGRAAKSGKFDTTREAYGEAAGQFFDLPKSGGQKNETRVKVDFANAPKGTRASVTKDTGGAVDMSMGYAMNPGGM